MKFGVEFAQRSIPRWKTYNIDYNLIKSLIKDATSDFDDAASSSDNTNNNNNIITNSNSKTNKNDSSASTLASTSPSSSNNSNEIHLSERQKKSFKKLYKAFKEQIDFVSLFAFSKVGEISRRLALLKRQCDLFIESESEFNNDNDNDNNNNNSDISIRLRNRKLLLFHNELNSITKELQDLSRFILLQKFALKKSFKKFNKYSSYPKKQLFLNKITQNFLIDNEKSFVHLNLNDLALETTLLYDFLDTFLNNNNNNNNNNNTNNNNSPSKKLIASSSLKKQRQRESSIHTIDSLQLTTNTKPSSSDSPNSKTPIFSKSTTFDIVSKRKGPRSLLFWVHYDNLDEVKFLLSSEFKLITDDSLFTKNKLKSTKSMMDLQNSQSSTPNDTMNKINCKTNNNQSEEFCPETDTVSVWLNDPSSFKFVQNVSPESLNYDVKENDNLRIFSASPYSQILVSNYKSSSINNPILITPVGGLRQFSIATLNKELVDSIFNNDNNDNSISIDEKKQKLFNEWENSGLKGNKQMTQLSIDWVLDNNVKPLASVSSKKLRYVNSNKNNKLDFYISLEWNIQIHKSTQNGIEDPNVQTFPHALLELNFDVNSESEFPPNIQNLINSYLVYRVDNLNFSLNNYLIYLHINEFHQKNSGDNNDDADGNEEEEGLSNQLNISDAEMLLFIAHWHDILLEKDIRILPEMKSQKPIDIRSSSVNHKYHDESYSNNEYDGAGDGEESDSNNIMNQNSGILLNKHDIAPRKPGYWNEFDNGSDYNNDTFYVYADDVNNDHNSNSLISWFSRLFYANVYDDDSNSDTLNDDLEINPNIYLKSGQGLEWLSPEKIEKISELADNTKKLGNKIKKSILDITGLSIEGSQHSQFSENTPLLSNDSNHHQPHYTRSYSFGANSQDYNADEEDDSDSETERLMAQIPSNNQNVSLKKSNYINNLQIDLRAKHDNVLSFLYSTLTIFAIFISIFSTIILSSIFNNSQNSGGVPNVKGGFLLITFALIGLVLSVILTGFSICFLLFRYSTPSIFHSSFVWTGSLISTILLLYGIIICF